MIYYPIARRFGDEIHDIREFITKDSLPVVEIAENMDISSKLNFIQSSWDYVVKNIKYPYFTKNNMEIADRHYLENYINPNAKLKVLRNTFVTGTLTGLTRKIFTGSIEGGVLTIAKDVLIGNGLYSLIIALLNNSNSRVYPKFAYEQYDFWNFPSETLRDMMGDCEDTSNLLCSILRNRLSADEVFVTVGFFEGYGHAWVTVFDEYKKPIALETTGDNVIKIDESIVEGHPYKPIFRFNDKKVVEVEIGEEFIINELNKKYEYEKIKSLVNFYVIKKRDFEYY